MLCLCLCIDLLRLLSCYYEMKTLGYLVLKASVILKLYELTIILSRTHFYPHAKPI